MLYIALQLFFPVYFITVKYIDFLPYAANLQLLIQAYVSSTGKVIFLFSPYQYHVWASGGGSHQEGVTALVHVHVDIKYTDTCKVKCHVNWVTATLYIL